ncbi:MAG: SAM-dependent methyltransferase [Pseudomonadota bacterium]
MSTAGAHFDALFEQDDDPWCFRSRWYEQRKRAVTLACLPDRRYGQAFEPGCANGELSAALAERCDILWVSDGSARALALARVRLAAWPQTRFGQHRLPQEWPAARFDLVVVSELAYYFSADELHTLAARIKGSLTEQGTVLACHWRHPLAGHELSADQVHALLGCHLGLPCITTLVEADFRIDVWSADARSVAQREGLV